MFKYLILVATFIPAIFATQGLMQCTAGHEGPLEVIVEGCDQAPCDIQLGSEAVMRVTFYACEYRIKKIQIPDKVLIFFSFPRPRYRYVQTKNHCFPWSHPNSIRTPTKHYWPCLRSPRSRWMSYCSWFYGRLRLPLPCWTELSPNKQPPDWALAYGRRWYYQLYPCTYQCCQLKHFLKFCNTFP